MVWLDVHQRSVRGEFEKDAESRSATISRRPALRIRVPLHQGTNDGMQTMSRFDGGRNPTGGQRNRG